MTDPLYLSQSEVSDWTLCPFRAHARWFLGYRASREETAPQRVGSMGHAILHDIVRARWEGREEGPMAAASAEAEKREWSQVSDGEYERALAGAQLAAEHVGLRTVDLVPDLYSVDRGFDASGRQVAGPLAEVQLRVGWADLRRYMLAQGGGGLWSGISRCAAVKTRFEGMEGRLDCATFPEGPGGPAAIIDWKMRQGMDLGGAAGDDFASPVPDRQFTWYQTILRALGLMPAGGIELWQVNVYAGRWLTVEDFLRVAEGGAQSEAEENLIVASGLPSRDSKRLGAVGAVSEAVWAEAHRVLGNRRHALMMDNWRADCAAIDAMPTKRDGTPRRKPRRPEMFTNHEQDGAASFLADLRAQRPVVVRKMRADLSVAMEVVRDCIVAVDGHLRHSLDGMTPARIIQSWPRSPCSRPGGCPVQQPCLSSQGTGRGVEAVKHLAAIEREAREERYAQVRDADDRRDGLSNGF